MNEFWWLLTLLGFLLFRAVGMARQSWHDSLPRDFDFDSYKAREINQRGVFDKTKWR